jgi:hypothetical protein
VARDRRNQPLNALSWRNRQEIAQSIGLVEEDLGDVLIVGQIARHQRGSVARLA